MSMSMSMSSSSCRAVAVAVAVRRGGTAHLSGVPTRSGSSSTRSSSQWNSGVDSRARAASASPFSSFSASPGPPPRRCGAGACATHGDGLFAARRQEFSSSSSTLASTGDTSASDGNNAQVFTQENRGAVLAAFRAVLRAEQRAFEGDEATLSVFRAETHKKFRETDVGASEEALVAAMQEVAETVQFLDENIVQGVRKEGAANAAPRGAPGAVSEGDHDENAESPETYQLRFRETSMRYKHWPPPGFDDEGRRIPGVPTIPEGSKPTGGCCGE